MKDESRGGRRLIAMMFVSLLGALGALSLSNLSCGMVAPNACAQEACPDVAALETRVMDFERRLQPLLAIAQLQCTAGNVLAWNGTTWECTKTIDGDLTITGSATIGRELTVTSATVRFGTVALTHSRASFQRLGTKIQYYKDGVLIQELDIGNGTQTLGGGANAYIHYTAGDTTSDARLLFSIEGLRTLSCTLVHTEDDTVVYGLAFATDSGNNYTGVWGGATKPTFVLSRQGTAANVISDNSFYDIVCF